MHSVSQQVSFNTEMCGTGWSSGCPSVPAGSGRSQEALHHRPGQGFDDDRDRDRLWGFLLGPTWPCAGDLQPCSLTWGHGCCSASGEASQALGMQCPGAAQLVGWTLTGHKPGAELPEALPTCLRCSPDATPGNGPVFLFVFLPGQ